MWCGCHPLSEPQPVRASDPKTAVLKEGATCSHIMLIYALRMVLHDTEYSSGLFESVAISVLPPSFWCTCTLARHGKLKDP